MDWSNNRNLTMLVDFYELTMGNGYLKEGIGNKRAVFDMFFRKVPDKAGFAICAGLEQLVGYLQNLHFSEEDIAFLRGKKIFSEAFLDYLRDFKFSCNVWAMKEGTPIFPERTGRRRRRPGHPGPAGGDDGAPLDQLPVAGHHQSQPHLPRRPGPPGHGVRLPPGPEL